MSEKTQLTIDVVVAALYERTVLKRNTQENWQAALQELSLTKLEPDAT